MDKITIMEKKPLKIAYHRDDNMPSYDNKNLPEGWYEYGGEELVPVNTFKPSSL